MIERFATCSCGALRIVAAGAPAKVSACHCHACQRRTGSAFGVAVFFEHDRTTPSGSSQKYTRLGDSGLPVNFHFCPTCGVSVFWYPAFRPGRVAIALGCFADPVPFAPSQSAYDQHRQPWVKLDLQ
jgi:hypothetical protein